MYKKIICIGNALVDKVCMLENDDLLSQEQLPKGSMQLVEESEMKRLLEKTNHLSAKMVTGGSAANTASGLANMGIPTSFIGVVGADDLGDFYLNDLKKNSIDPHIIRSSQFATGLALTLVSQDGERTFATNLGAAVSLSVENINADFLKQFDYLHVEGYLISNRPLLKKIIASAKSAGCKVSIDLASYNVVEENLEFLKTICKDIEVIFANEQEAEAFCGKKAEEAIDDLAKYAAIAVVKTGEKGSLVKHAGKTYVVSKSEHTLIDTTGAGDLYAGGFLAGLCSGKDVLTCGRMGSILAGNVIEVMGTKMSAEQWAKIRSEIETLS